ncbi:MAG: hypothetical protein MUO76_18925, partial [Anaerolineaceae bacterium]|nr:hypothetical protein [Anaerolineaceae bacterium]
LAYEMLKTGPEMEAKLWKRLLVISVEDIGMGNPHAPILVHTLFKMHQEFSEGALDRPLFAIHAVRFLCSCEKDRSSDEMLNWVKLSGNLPDIPDYAIDMHTGRGQEMGRDIQHFLKEGAKINPEKPDREKTYYKKLIEILGKE